MHRESQKPFANWMQAHGWLALDPVGGEETLRFQKLCGLGNYEQLATAIVYRTGLMNDTASRLWWRFQNERLPQARAA